MSQLDDPALYALDRNDMLGHIRSLGSELIHAWDASAKGERTAARRTMVLDFMACVGEDRRWAGARRLPAGLWQV